MAHMINMDAFASRKAALERQIEQREAELRALVAKREDLLVAERVLSEFARDDTRETNSEEAEAQKNTRHKGTPRPDDVPTTVDMIKTLLRKAQESGKKGLGGTELVHAIDRRWWSGVGYNSVVPTAARLARDGHLEKRGTLYAVPDIPEPSNSVVESEALNGHAASASEAGEVSASPKMSSRTNVDDLL